jgi:Fe-S cluster assembly iron-binding protein IscA
MFEVTEKALNVIKSVIEVQGQKGFGVRILLTSA